jgi:hypothetical protein
MKEFQSTLKGATIFLIGQLSRHIGNRKPAHKSERTAEGKKVSRGTGGVNRMARMRTEWKNEEKRTEISESKNTGK